MSTAVAHCPRCDAAHPDPEAWLAPLRDGDAHRALEALVAQWLRPVKLPPLTHASLPQALGVLGPAIEPVLSHNHLMQPEPDGVGRWCFAYENQGVWHASVDTRDRVTVDAYGAEGPLDEFLLGFVLRELSAGLPVTRYAVIAAGDPVGFQEVPTLAPWGGLAQGGEAERFFVGEGVIASAWERRGCRLILGAACPGAMERAEKLLPATAVIAPERRRRPPDTTPWNLR